MLREPRAAIFDLDGVLVDTARLHSRAWKRAFDSFFEAEGIDDTFDEDQDYRRHVDGRPRYEGVAEFLRSREIELPPGHQDDDPGLATQAAIGNLKNRMFHQLVDEEGVDPLPGALALLESLSAARVPVAVVSSSQNAPQVLPDGLRTHIALVLGGDEMDTLDIPGKPDPGMFLEGARQLSVPAEETAVVEDAPAGVRAGIAGGFAVVVGVDRERSGHLDDAGADLVISGVSHLPPDISAWAERIPDPGPALDSVEAIIATLGDAPAIFLDYDGTLTPIVDDPAAATISSRERAILGGLAEVAPVAIISGRSLEDVRQHVGVEGITYSGSHGFEIAHPDGTLFVQPDAATVVPELDDAEQALRQEAEGLPGVMIERKPYAIAVHTRRARGQEEKEKARELAEAVGSSHPGLIVRAGKEIFELRPDLDWDKGFALSHLLESLPPGTVPLYMGDDDTDEDAFADVRRRFGVGILVGTARGGETWAGYTVPGTDEALRLLSSMTEEFSR